MKSGSECDDGFVIRTPKVLYGVSFRPFGPIFASKTTLMTVCSVTAVSESKSEAGFVISSPDYMLYPIFGPFGSIFVSKTTLMTVCSDTAEVLESNEHRIRNLHPRVTIGYHFQTI